MLAVDKDGKVQAKMMEKISDTRDQYYVDSDGVVLLKYNNNWVPYLDVMVGDSRLQDELINCKVNKVRLSIKTK
jgi:hypothetical protein